jgi:5-methylcytosine-specific restriction endonuclease McrA
MNKTMSKDTVLIEQLRQLQRQYGMFQFTLALQDLKRRRLEVEQRQKRKRFPWSKYQALYSSQKGICRLCRRLMPLLRGEVEIDHKDPNRQEGFNDDDNLQLTHRRCNRKKSSGSLYQQAKKMNRTIIELL